jgi:hypothetical protein
LTAVAASVTSPSALSSTQSDADSAVTKSAALRTISAESSSVSIVEPNAFERS